MRLTTLRDRVAEPLFAVIHFDLEPNLITFTATGLAVGLLAAALLYVRNYSLTRTN
ncbi:MULTISPECIES: hypothetical protein [Rhodococcus]|uniref:hypothetical protein n=1 Tax=Rhodococcus TaxID=1827 RepID=UPI0012EC629C|nr:MULTISPECIES: hypothetical protein [Rhodococcus]QXC41996.1 hypothetical protein KSE96_23415 [Rhodococcus qingshengii]